MPNAIEEKDINTQEKIKHIIEKIKEIGKIVSQDYLDTDKLVQKLELYFILYYYLFKSSMKRFKI